MSHGGTQGRHAALFALFLTLAALSAIFAHPPPASDLTVTLISWNHGRIQAQGEAGRTLAITTTPATWVLRRGLPAETREFTPGETLQVRLGRGVGGTMRALLVCDPETAEALTAQRGHPLFGTLLNIAGKVWIIQPDDGTLPLPLCISAHTTFQAGQSPVTSRTFRIGARVTIKTRGLPNGLPTAVSISEGAIVGETAPEGEAKRVSRSRKTFSGTVLAAQPGLGLLTLQDKTGASQTIIVDSQTQIQLRRRKNPRLGTWDDLVAGRHVFARFSGTTDAGGSPLASSLSVSDP